MVTILPHATNEVVLMAPNGSQWLLLIDSNQTALGVEDALPPFQLQLAGRELQPFALQWLPDVNSLEMS